MLLMMMCLLFHQTLEIEILHFVFVIASIAGVLSTIILITWAAWLRRDYPDFIDVPTLLIDLVSISVAFLPEGLPSTIVLSLSVMCVLLSASSRCFHGSHWSLTYSQLK